jgi:stage IV sporulation protein FB
MIRSNPWLRTLFSLALYVSVYYILFRDLRSIGLLVLVIVLHELGHYIAMRAFGYRNLEMLFVPMLGAYVSGQHESVEPAKRLIVLFAGPIPGLVLGTMFGMLYSYHHHYILYLLALMFILLNLFNLIPIAPMDGGQILNILFPRIQRSLQTIFILLAAVVITYILVFYKTYILALLILLLASRLFRLWQRQPMQEQEHKKTEPLSELSRNEKIMFITLWVVAIIIPLQTLYRVI